MKRGDCRETVAASKASSPYSGKSPLQDPDKMQGKSLLSTERLPARNSAERAPCFRYLRSESKLLIFERLVSYCFRLIRGQTQPHLQHKITLTCRNRNTPSLFLTIEPKTIPVKGGFQPRCCCFSFMALTMSRIWPAAPFFKTSPMPFLMTTVRSSTPQRATGISE